MTKYIVIKKDPHEDREYMIRIEDDSELLKHLTGTYDCTNHKLLGVVRVVE